MTLPIGRFAPSPTGKLHLGSLTTAVASFCHIKSLGGKWLVRMEDVDVERCKDSYANDILKDLENLHLHSDDTILYQSRRLAVYDEYLHTHLTALTYACQCSRQELKNHPATPALPCYYAYQNTQDLNLPTLYPRLCLHRNIPSCSQKIRLMLPDVWTVFHDGILGKVWDNPAKSLGDVVVKRQNGVINYILACAIDDGLQNVSHIMRGSDILPMTVAQLAIINACHLSQPSYFYHLPLLHNTTGQKLSKQNLATAIDTTNPDKARLLLVHALKLLGQPIMADLHTYPIADILQFAITHWDITPLKHKHSLGAIPN